MKELIDTSVNTLEPRTIPTFDFIDIQFYESYSRSGKFIRLFLDLSFKSLISYLLIETLTSKYSNFYTLQDMQW